MLFCRKTSAASFACCILLLGLICCIKCEDAADGEKSTKILHPPKAVRTPFWPVGETLTQTVAQIMWDEPATAQKYIVTLYEVHGEERILNIEVTNVEKNRFVFLLLTPSTDYESIVRAVRVEPDGQVTVSEPSEPYRFTTLQACTGGRIHSPCRANCIATCEIQRPVCSRECKSGCACPTYDTPFLHNDVCITKKRCNELGAPIIEVLARPKNLKVHPLKGSMDVVFTWDEVEGATFYTVLVLMRDGTKVQSIDTDIAFVVIKGLEQKVRYKFRVQAKWRAPVGAQRSLELGKEGPTVTDIEHASFVVRWEQDEEAESYTVRVYRNGAKSVSGYFPGLKETYVTIQGLVPDTEYDVTVSVVTEYDEEESPKTEVRTKKSYDDGSYEPEEEFTVTMPTTTTTMSTTTPTTEPYVPTCEEVRSAAIAFAEDNPDAEIPQCDSYGNYRTTQCHPSGCYCVEKRGGEKKAATDFDDKDSIYALNCNALGDYNVDIKNIRLSAIGTRTMRVTWDPIYDDLLLSYTVQVYEGFTSAYVTHVSELKKTEVEIDRLKPGFPYIVIVVALNSVGQTSTNKVKGEYIVMPFLDAPENVVAEQLPEKRFKVSWRRAPGAEHYSVEVFENGATRWSMKYENVTDAHKVIPLDTKNTYKVAVRATAVTQIQGRGKLVMVSSNPTEIEFVPTEPGTPSSCVIPPMDIVFGIDVSEKNTLQNFNKSKQLFIKLANSLAPIVKDRHSKTGSRVALVKGHDGTRTVFRYSRFDNVQNLVGAINFLKPVKTKKPNKLFNVGRMLNTIYTSFYTSANNDDQRGGDIQTAVVLFYGSRSDDSVATSAAKLRGVTQVIAVGVKGHASFTDVTVSGSKRDKRIWIDSYDDMDKAHEQVVTALCAK